MKRKEGQIFIMPVRYYSNCLEVGVFDMICHTELLSRSPAYFDIFSHSRRCIPSFSPLRFEHSADRFSSAQSGRGEKSGVVELLEEADPRLVHVHISFLAC